MRAVFSSVVALALVGCGDNLQRPDAAGPIDMPADVAVDAGPCGTGQFVTGELIDLDSTTANFKGVNNTRLTVRNSTVENETDTTSPNGRFELCAPAGPGPIIFDMVADANASPRYHDGWVVLDRGVVDSTPGLPANLVSLRAFDQVRRFTFYVDRGLAYDPTKAHVLVWSAWDHADIDLDRAHDEPQTGIQAENTNVVTWGNGNDGDYVLFANVDPALPTGTLTMSPALQPNTYSIPLAADKLTIVGAGWVLVGP